MVPTEFNVGLVVGPDRKLTGLADASKSDNCGCKQGGSSEPPIMNARGNGYVP